jgi:hypothetical protein
MNKLEINEIILHGSFNRQKKTISSYHYKDIYIIVLRDPKNTTQ